MKTSEFSAPMPEDIAHILSETNATPIRTRGLLPPGGSGERAGELTDLKKLLHKLREEVGNFPLTFVIHDWGMRQANRFFWKLKPLLYQDDRLWFIQSQQYRDETEGTPGVLLDIEYNESDKHLVEMLVSDLVFFAGQRINVQQIKTWKHRARATIVYGEGPSCATISRKAEQLALRTYVMTDDSLRRVS